MARFLLQRLRIRWPRRRRVPFTVAAAPGEVTATANILEDDDTLASTAGVSILLTAAITEEDDTLSSTAIGSSNLDAAITEDDDTMAAEATAFDPDPNPPSNTPWHTKRRRRNVGPYRLGAPAL